MNLINIQDNKANLHMTHNLVMAQIAMRQLQRDGHTVTSIDVNGRCPMITIEPPLNDKAPLCVLSTTNGKNTQYKGRLYHCRKHIADVKWQG